MNRLYLVRHGENPANVDKKFSYKAIDYSLNEKGIMQARQTGEFFKNIPVDEVYSSPLKRTLETAQFIAEPHNLPVIQMEEFREINVGTLEGHNPTKEDWKLYIQTVTDWLQGKPELSFPGGENYIQLLERMQSGIRKIVAGKDNKNIVIAGHGGLFTMTIKDLCQNAEIKELIKIDINNCSITEIEVDLSEDNWNGKLLTWGSCDHLSGSAAKLVSPALIV